MSYCPEDGTKMLDVCTQIVTIPFDGKSLTYYNSCYTCSSCGSHWRYDGDLASYTNEEGVCSLHEECEQCAEEKIEKDFCFNCHNEMWEQCNDEKKDCKRGECPKCGCPNNIACSEYADT